MNHSIDIINPIIASDNEGKDTPSLTDMENYSPHRHWLDATFQQADESSESARPSTYFPSEHKSDIESNGLLRSSSEESLDSASTYVVSSERDSVAQPEFCKSLTDDNRLAIIDKDVSVAYDYNDQNSSKESIDVSEPPTVISTPISARLGEPIAQSNFENTIADAVPTPISARLGEPIAQSNFENTMADAVSTPVPARRRKPIFSPENPAHSCQLVSCSRYNDKIHSIESDVSMLIETNESLSKLLVEQETAHENEMQHLKEEIRNLKVLFSTITRQLESPPNITNLRTRACDSNIYQVEWDLKIVEGYEVILNGEPTDDIVQQKKCYLSDVLEKTSVQIQAIGITGARGELSEPVIVRPFKK